MVNWLVSRRLRRIGHDHGAAGRVEVEGLADHAGGKGRAALQRAVVCTGRVQGVALSSPPTDQARGRRARTAALGGRSAPHWSWLPNQRGCSPLPVGARLAGCTVGQRQRGARGPRYRSAVELPLVAQRGRARRRHGKDDVGARNRRLALRLGKNARRASHTCPRCRHCRWRQSQRPRGHGCKPTARQSARQNRHGIVRAADAQIAARSRNGVRPITLVATGWPLQ